MALQRKYKFKRNGVTWLSGHIYTFKYQAWENDPKPVIIFMYAFAGTHPKTGREWRFLQGINFTYIPKGDRKRFAKLWIKEFERLKGNTRLTYRKVKRRYPYLTIATRRYMYTPAVRIAKAKEIPFTDWQKAVVSTMTKDFSKKVASSLIKKFRRVVGGKKRRKNKRSRKK